MGWVRRPNFAGSWYPRREAEVKDEIDLMLQRAFPCPDSAGEPVGCIVPHAGWYYSGKLALSTLKCLSLGKKPDTLILFGHHLAERYPNVIMPKGVWQTPLGDLPVDEELGERLSKEFRFEIESENSYHPDNTIEIQLPFIRYLFGEVKILPIGIAPTRNNLSIARRIVELSTELKRSIKVVGSTDLTHYGSNYGFMPAGSGPKAVKWVKEENDKRIVDLFLRMAPEEILLEAKERQNACCPGAAASAIESALQLGANTSKLIGYHTSYDVLANESFVGYVGVVYLKQ